jgi:hypothetical protein
MIINDRNTELIPSKTRRKNVFSPAQVRRAGGLRAISAKFENQRTQPMPNLGFTDNEWRLMLKNE